MASRPEFGAFVAPEAAKIEVLDRARYTGLSPADAAELVVGDYHAKKPLKASTRANRVVVLRKILTDLSQQGFDLANLTTAGITAYRAYLRSLLDGGHLAENYVYRLTVDWNATVNCLFGQRELKAGQEPCLKMKGFRQIAKQGDHLTIEEMEAMISQLPELRVQSDHYREAVHTYLEVAMSSAGRWDSIGSPETTFGCINWSKGTIRFPKVKNRERHDALLTERALRRLREHRQHLIKHNLWIGEDATPLMMVPRGVVSYKSMNDYLHKLAVLARLPKNVTTHVPRKSVGTHMAKENPRLAREQLGITQKVFEKHYNQPTLDDRLDRRDLLLGAGSTTKSPAERIGVLYLDLAQGKISQEEFDQAVKGGLLAEATKPKPTDQDLAYG